VSDRHGGLRWRASSEPQAVIAWSRRAPDASEIRASLSNIKGHKNDFRVEAVQRPTMKFIATKTADQLDLQALHRVREGLVRQRRRPVH